MERWSRGLVLTLALAFSGACTLSPGAGDPAVSPLAAEAIEVATLPPAGGTPATADGATAVGSTPDPLSEPDPEPDQGAVARTEAAPPPPSPEALACQRRGGTYLRLAGGRLGTCQISTGEGQKSCARGSDCAGDCLARSRTCAPVRPLFGCNEVLDDMGRRMTQCLQ